MVEARHGWTRSSRRPTSNAASSHTAHKEILTKPGSRSLAGPQAVLEGRAGGRSPVGTPGNEEKTLNPGLRRKPLAQVTRVWL